VTRLVPLSLLALVACAKHEASIADYEKIHRDMTRAQVDAALSKLGAAQSPQTFDLVDAADGVTLVRWGSPTHALFVGFDSADKAKQRSLRIPSEQRDEAWDATVTFEPGKVPHGRVPPAEPIPDGIYAADDLTALRGKWKMTACTMDGRPMMNDVEWNFDLDSYEIRLKGGSPVKFKFRLDPNKKPKRFATGLLLLPDGKGANQTGIYELDGDELKLCLDVSGRSYPDSFDAPKGSHRMSYRFAREH